MDGLTVEFYRVFWDVLGSDFVTVWAESLGSRVLPLPCRHAVLALLLKKGNLHDLQNCWPISILSTDYKVVVKVISLQLGSMLADVVHPDQAYAMPSWVSPSLTICTWSGTFWSSGLERVCHLPACPWRRRSTEDGPWVSPGHSAGIRLWVFSRCCTTLQLNWTLTKSVSFGREVSQGCLLSGQLRTLAIDRPSSVCSTSS
ncbi:unnamed protein product [Caretta caretta]